MNRLELLDSSHERTGFDCGSVPLNHYIQQVARQHSDRGISRVFVLVDEDAQAPKPLLGLFSLAACEAEREIPPAAISRKLPRKIPAVRLGRLAVDKAFQGRGYGKDLVLLAMKKTAEGAAIVGMAGLFVDAKDEGIAGFYARFGFIPQPDQPLPFFFPSKPCSKFPLWGFNLPGATGIAQNGTEQSLTECRCAPIVEHHENGNRSGFEEPLHQLIKLAWSRRRNFDYAARQNDCPAHPRAGPAY